ncbi:hypothetical protein Gpo141_00002273 [Globisporangium polare]
MRPSAPTSAVAQPALMTALVYQYVLAATSAILVHMLLRSSNADFGGSSETVTYQSQSDDPDSSTSSSSSSSSSCGPSARRPSATATSIPSRGADSIHQTGTKYRSNNAGDGPEKTRDRKSWFPRFKSNWLGTYRSKQMFHCCECAVVDAASARYKGSEGKHCVCGQDQWHLAKTIEEAEYNRRMEISKALGGLRYDEALERLKAMGTSELDLKRLRCESDEASVTSSSTSSSVGDDSNSADGPHGSSCHKRIKNEPLPSPATRAYGSQQRAKAAASFGLDPVALPSVNASTGLTAELLQKINQSYSSGSYTPLGGDYLGGAASYDHLVPASFADEENFGELLQGFLEDDPRHVSGSGYPSHYQQPQHSRQPQYSYNNNASSYIPGGSSAPMGHQQPHHHRYPQAPSTLPPPPQGEVDFEFFSDGHHRGMAPAQTTSSSASGYYGQPHHSGAVPHGSQYGRPHLAHPHSSMAAPLASSTSFSIV